VIWTMAVRDPLKPEVVSIWGFRWQKANDKGESNGPRPDDTACTVHGPPVIRGNRMFAAFWGGGIAVIDCTDPQLVAAVARIEPYRLADRRDDRRLRCLQFQTTYRTVAPRLKSRDKKRSWLKVDMSRRD
jgi:hypothetical protein